MSKIRLLDLFEKPSLDLEKVYFSSGCGNYIQVPVDINFQRDDFFNVENGWKSFFDYYGSSLDNYDKSAIINDLNYVLKHQKPILLYLRRRVILKDDNYRYLRGGDIIKEGDVILKNNHIFNKENFGDTLILGEKYNDKDYLGLPFKKITRRIELVK